MKTPDINHQSARRRLEKVMRDHEIADARRKAQATRRLTRHAYAAQIWRTLTRLLVPFGRY